MEGMAGVVFVAPYLLEATLRFVRVTAELEGVRLALLTNEPLERVPADLRARLAAHYRVADALDPGQIEEAVKAVAGAIGGVHRVMAALEELQVPLGVVRERLGLPGMGVRVAERFRDKGLMKTVLQEAGLPCARHRQVESVVAAERFAAEIGFPLVVKPPAGSGARDTYRVDNGQQLARVLQVVPPSPHRPLLLEEFITGLEHSFDTVCIDGEPVWYSVSDYLPSPLEVMENPWIQWCVLLPREIEVPRYHGIRTAGVATLKTLGMGTGLSHMEWFERPGGGVAISEVGARPPGAQFTTMISYAYDFDLYRAWVRLMVYNVFQPHPRAFAVGAAYLRGLGQGRVKHVHGLAQAQRELGDIVVEAKLPRPGQAASGSYEGEGYVIVRHPDTAVVERALARLVTLLRVELTADGR